MKNRWYKKCAAAALAVCLLAQSAAAAVRQDSSMRLNRQVSLTGSYLQIDEKSVREQVLTYEAGGEVKPVVAYGTTLYGRSTMDYIEEGLAEQGWDTVAAVNAAFFDMKNGVPYGMVVTDGILRSSGDVVSVGIWEKGHMEIGRPGLEVRMVWKDQEITLNYNKAASKANGYCLYSGDYDNSTKNTLECYNLLLRPQRDSLKVSDSVAAEVIQIAPKTAACRIPEGCFVLSLALDTDYASALEQIKQFAVGDQVTIATRVDRGWEDVQYAVGGGDLLVEQGTAATEFTLDSAGRAAARTALGIKANGEVICYTAEKSDVSAGLTLQQLAQRMEELGCERAVNLDGGGSTTVGAALPGETVFTTLNEPTDGSQRPCANFLFFVRPKQAAGNAAQLHLYPYDAAVLVGGSVELTVRATDADYRAAQVPSGVVLTADGGTVTDGVFTATRSGMARVTASAGTVTGTVNVQVVETPTAITVKKESSGQKVTDLLLEVGGTVDLTAEAEYLGLELSAQDASFTWDVDPAVASVDEKGLLTAVGAGKCKLYVTCGNLTEILSVEVRSNPFADTEKHWARSPVAQMYFRGVLQGSSGGDGVLRYRPDDSMTRQEFVVAMVRAAGVDAAKYKDAELTFADKDKIADWALDAVKAAKALGWMTGSSSGDKVYANPTDTISREEAMTMLARSVSVTSDSEALDEFSDVKRVSDWAKPYLTAMVEKGIVNGMDGKLQPQGKVTRGQVAKILYEMAEKRLLVI